MPELLRAQQLAQRFSYKEHTAAMILSALENNPSESDNLVTIWQREKIVRQFSELPQYLQDHWHVISRFNAGAQYRSEQGRVSILAAREAPLILSSHGQAITALMPVYKSTTLAYLSLLDKYHRDVKFVEEQSGNIGRSPKDIPYFDPDFMAPTDYLIEAMYFSQEPYRFRFQFEEIPSISSFSK